MFSGAKKKRSHQLYFKILHQLAWLPVTIVQKTASKHLSPLNYEVEDAQA